MLILPQSLVGGRKLWVGLFLYEHNGACRCLCTSFFVWIHPLKSLWKDLYSRSSLGQVAPSAWAKSFGYRVAIDLYAIPCSFCYLNRCTISKRWQVLNVEAIVVEPLHHLWVPWSLCVFYCHRLRWCFKLLMCTSCFIVPKQMPPISFGLKDDGWLNCFCFVLYRDPTFVYVK